MSISDLDIERPPSSTNVVPVETARLAYVVCAYHKDTMIVLAVYDDRSRAVAHMNAEKAGAVHVYNFINGRRLPRLDIIA